MVRESSGRPSEPHIIGAALAERHDAVLPDSAPRTTAMSLDPSAPRTVHKFGGVSLADGAGVRRVAAILRERAPSRPIAVVSAVEGVTSLLDATARAAATGAADVTPVRIRHRTLLAQLAL